MMIMKMFPKKLFSKIKQYAKSLEILSAFESIKIHFQFCSQIVAPFPATGSVVLFVNDMISFFAFQPCAVGASVSDQKQSVDDILRHNLKEWILTLSV